MNRYILFLLLIGLSACQAVPHVVIPPTATKTVHAEISPPSLTSTPLPTIAQLIYPYTIDGLRHHKYLSGSVTIGTQLARTDVFTSYQISYPSDGLIITGMMQVPAQGRIPFPVIVMDHGFFAREEYTSGDGTDRAATFLNQHGYLTLSPDYRTWGKSDIGPSLFYSGLAIDVINLISAVPTIPQADSKHIGIWGHSMGGGVTMKVLTVDPSIPRVSVDHVPRIRAAVLYSTVSADDSDILARWGLGCIGDIVAGEHQLDCNSSDVVPLNLPPDLIKAYYEASMDAGLLHETSSIYHLDAISAPIEINYGTEDGRTLAGAPPDWSKKLYLALKESGKPAELFGYEGQFHSFSGDSWFAFMERSSRFFDQYVKGSP